MTIFDNASVRPIKKAAAQSVDFEQQGWDLDKYKNIHIAEKAFNMRPNYDWYLFVDADAYVVWPTILHWLEKLYHTDPVILGSKTSVGNSHFGDGGSGYVVSNRAMRDFFEGKHNVANRWDEATKNHCCGDLMFAKALTEITGISVNDTVRFDPYSVMSDLYRPLSSLNALWLWKSLC